MRRRYPRGVRKIKRWLYPWFTAMTATRMSIEDAFLHDILAQPDDDAPRLIYADWLDERNDPRGEFIRVQCALAQLSAEDPRRWPLEQRQQELLSEHETKWLPKNIDNASCVFRRGFVEEISLLLQDFLTEAKSIFEQTPLRHVCLRGPISSAECKRYREGIGLRHVMRSPHLARLRGLSLAFPPVVDDWRCLSESSSLANLTDLKLFASELPSLVFRELMRTPYLANLRYLNLARTALMIDDLRFLADSPSLASLRELNLSDNNLTHEAARILAEGRLLSQLETLHLDSNLLGDAGALIVREWPALPRLARLSLGHNQIFAAGVRALAQAPALRELIALDLFGNISCDDGTAALASSNWSRLQALNLRFNGVGDKGVRALASSESLSQLTRLDLIANRITNGGARALIKSSGLPRLARLDLLRNDIGAAAQQRLRDRLGAFVYC